jgi:type IV pilus assembly protein PilB
VSRVKIIQARHRGKAPAAGRPHGAFRRSRAHRDIDFRVSVLPTLFGEKVVLRLLDPEGLKLDMSKLGFDADALMRFERNIRKPWGMVLVTGPTGSGKTNTLYSSLAQINQPGVNIMTAEDPVEFNLQGINQVQVRENIGLNFASVLRSFLRQDPNIILVGEIRDSETASIAVKAALTGHLVLSTLHTNDAPSSINRLVNMGVEPFLVGNSVNLVCAQRLVRRVCEACKEPEEMSTTKLVEAGVDKEDVADFKPFRGKGCERAAG